MNSKLDLRSIFQDHEIMRELRHQAATAKLDVGSTRSVESVPVLEHPEQVQADSVLEAIVMTYGRPALLVQDDSFEVPASDVWRKRLYPTRSLIERALKSIGRVEVFHHPTHTWLGTAWIIEDGIAVTNRHVAAEFAQKRRSGWTFKLNPEGIAMGSQINFRREYSRLEARGVEVERIVWLADEVPGGPDLAILKLSSGDGLEPLRFDPHFDYSCKDRWIATIGHPANDPRNPADAIQTVFQGIFDVKRLSPGAISSSGEPNGITFRHDCSTLGGNSGSAVIDVASGSVVGLHFAGEYGIANYAVKTGTVLELLQQAKVSPQISVPEPLPFAVAESTPLNLEDRAGYDPHFLGIEIPLPTLSENLLKQATRLKGKKDEFLLRYEHFSLVMHKERQLAIFTASNIDGREARNIRRQSDVWLYDLRIDRDDQIGHELYRGTDLDRGHLTRRMDPAWGPFDIAKKAEIDTFHFTNCAPQFSKFNRQLWLGLEDYLLDNTNKDQMRISVYTGPVLDEKDPPFREARIPQQFWKVVSFVKPDGNLSSTAYVVSQKDLLTRLEFVFGEFKTYQTSVRHVATLTGLGFGDLPNFDPLNKLEGPVGSELYSFDQIRF